MSHLEAYWQHVLHELSQLLCLRPRHPARVPQHLPHRTALEVGFGRIVVSDIEVPNMLANLECSG
jgi:hypothetical protein